MHDVPSSHPPLLCKLVIVTTAWSSGSLELLQLDCVLSPFNAFCLSGFDLPPLFPPPHLPPLPPPLPSFFPPHSIRSASVITDSVHMAFNNHGCGHHSLAMLPTPPTTAKGTVGCDQLSQRPRRVCCCRPLVWPRYHVRAPVGPADGLQP